jgi:hypothetical protein
VIQSGAPLAGVDAVCNRGISAYIINDISRAEKKERASQYTYVEYNMGAKASNASNTVHDLFDILNKYTNISNKSKYIYWESKPSRAQIFWQTPSFIKGAATPGQLVA